MEESPQIELVRDSDDRETKTDVSEATSRLNHWLAILVERGGSDLLLVPNVPACIRREGQVINIESAPLHAEEIENAVLPALSSHALRLYKETQIGDSSYRIAGLGRFRINLHHERGRPAAAIRALPTKVPALRDLHLHTTEEGLASVHRRS